LFLGTNSECGELAILYTTGRNKTRNEKSDVDSPANLELWPPQNPAPDVTYPHDLLHRICRMPM